MKRIVLAALLLFASATTHAQTRPENTVKITMEQADRVLNGLTALDGYPKVIKDGGQDKAVTISYELSGNTRKLIAKDMDLVMPALKRYGKVRQGLVKQYLDRDTVPDVRSDEYAKLAATEKFKQLSDELQKLLDQPIDEELTKISDADLKLDVNPIPPSVLSMLSPIRIP